jgi:hypothetical protein
MVDIATVTIIISIAAIVPLYVDLFFRLTKKHVEVDLERFREHSTTPIESWWTIRVLYPSKTIERCSVVMQGLALQVWNRKEPAIEAKISKGGAANFRIPAEVHPLGNLVVVRDGKKVLKKQKFLHIPEVEA